METRPVVLAWLQLVRAPAIFSAVSNVLAAHLIVTAGQITFGALALLTGISGCLYAAGMVLNDCFDVDEDRRDRPERPLPAGRIRLRTAWWAGAGLLLVANALATALGTTQALITLALTGMILFYDGIAKRSIAGPPAMAACRYLNWLLGLSTGAAIADVWLLPVPIFGYVFALTLLSRGETTAAAATNPLPIVAGLVAALAVVLLPGYVGLLSNPPVLILLLAGGGWLVYRIWRLRDRREPEAVQATVSLMIFAIIPLDALLASAAGPWWAGFVVLLLLVPARLLGRILYVT